MSSEPEDTLAAPGEESISLPKPVDPGSTGERASVERLSRSIRSLFGETEPAAAPPPEHPFLRQLRSFSAAEEGERRALAHDIRVKAAELEGDEALDLLAMAVSILALSSTPPSQAPPPEDSEDPDLRATEGSSALEDDEALRLARDLAVPAVARRVALHIGLERSEELRDRWLRVARALPDLTAPAFAAALADDDELGSRRAYLDALKSLGKDGREAAVRMLRGDRWFIIRNGIHVLAEHGGEGAVALVTATLAHRDVRVRREAVIALVKLGGDDAGLLLLGMLSDPDSDVREAAAMGLGILKFERAVRPLLQQLEAEEVEDVQIQLLQSLGQIGDPGAVPEIEKRAVGGFFSRPHAAIRIAAYRALAAIGTPHARQVLESAKQDTDPEVRKAVGAILAAHPGRVARPVEAVPPS